MDRLELEDMAAPTVSTLSMVSALRVTSSASSTAFSRVQSLGIVTETLRVLRSISGMNTKPRWMVSTADPASSTTAALSTMALCPRDQATALR